MRKNVTLHIGDIRADLDNNALILFNYTQEDLQNPTIVKNSYSQQVTLKGTDVNNRIFGTYFRNDRVSDGGFNALQKTPFTIYNEMNEILESGYCKLESVERKGADISYKVSLYGGLGGFFYGLMYDADGNKRNLADLIYTSGGDSHEFDFAINKDAVANAWKRLQGDTTQDVKWDHINFAPCYNGLPGGGFAAEKAFCPTACYGVTSSVTDGGVTYSARHNNVLVKLAKKYNEWDTGDLRSYLQRPVVRMKSIIDAIADSSQNGGYVVELDTSFFKNANPHYRDAWLTLPRLDSIQMPISSGSSSVLMPTGDSTYVTASTTKSADLSDGNKGMNVMYDCSVTIQPCLQMPEGKSNDGRLLTVERTDVSMVVCRRSVVVYQLLGYNSNGELVCGSDIIAATTGVRRVSGTTHTYTDYTSTRQWLTKYNDAISQGSSTKYYPTWGSIDVNASTSMVIGDRFANGMLVDGNGNNKTVTLNVKGYGITSVVLRTSVLSVYEQGLQSLPNSFTFSSFGYAYELDNGYAIDAQLFDGMNHTSGTVTYSWQSEGVQVRSNADITKQILLGGTDSPADYLLSYCKMFGLYFVMDNATKQVTILKRNSLYQDETIDLTRRVDLSKGIDIQPLVFNSKWYDFILDGVGGAFYDEYLNIEGIPYGIQRVNTGYDFNAESVNLMDTQVFKNAATILARSRYWNIIISGSAFIPSPFLDNGNTITRWNADDETQDTPISCPPSAASVTYYNTDFPGYDIANEVKMQFADAAGKMVDGQDVLLFLNGFDFYGDFKITDDLPVMAVVNDGKPCWILDGGDGVLLPIFSGYKLQFQNPHMVMQQSLDFGVPRQLDIPGIVYDPDTTIYARAWRAYLSDRYNVNTKVMTCRVDFSGIRVSQDLLRKFFWYDNSIWVLNKITNYSLTTYDPVECEFVQVQDKSNYLNGQSY